MTQAAKWQLEILDLRPARGDYCWLDLAAPAEWQSRPGQFVNIRCDDPAGEAAGREIEWDGNRPPEPPHGRAMHGSSPLVRRPISISQVVEDADGQRRIVLLVRVVGPGSQLLSDRKPGDVLDVIGPLGNGFDLDGPASRAVLVGGGCGIAPLVGLADALARKGKQVTVFYGERSGNKIPLPLPETAGPTGDKAIALRSTSQLPEVEVVLATENGSLGFKGLVTDAMIAWGAERGWDDAELFVCGPDVMMAAVAALARAQGIERCQVSLENYMGCAIGVCLSCAVKVRADNDKGWTYKLVCQDGPVFEAADVVFENKWEGCTK
ncbi:MAG: dihydroorotate dehydrogenase electron transfer subunit [Planctomycetes bacterium]|nr:dihydroorotate dehydrogenase electron transfer subunit [Planctomycetota bacterium]